MLSYFSGILFLILGASCIILSLFLLIRFGFNRLETTIGIMGDGLQIGKQAPPWNLADADGTIISSPSHLRWQLLLFADHSLLSFPSLIAGLNNLASSKQDLEIYVLARQDQEFCQSIARNLQLNPPVIPVDNHFYDEYSVRVMPYVIVLNPQGKLYWKGLINTEEQLFHMWEQVNIRNALVTSLP